MKKPAPHSGLRHVALYVKHFDACVHFYMELLGFKIDWQPDADNFYLTSGDDNLALHRASEDFAPSTHQHLDHIGLFLKTREDVDAWHHFMVANHCEIKAAPKDHRDGTRSFYCADPDGNVVQMMYVP